jgi:PAS domain S-box-containing protein
MDIQFSYYAALLFLSAIITASLAMYGWHNRKIPVAQPFTLLMAAATLWTLGEAIQGLNVSLAISVIVNTIEYPGIVIVPVAWFILSLYYTGRKRYVTRTTLSLLFIIPTISVFLVATNPVHYLFYTSFSPRVVDGITIWLFNHGPLFPIHIVYTYLLSILAFILVLIQLFVQFDRYRKQTLILLVASAIPLIFNIMYVIQPNGLPEYDLTPFSFTIMGILIALGIIRYRLFSAVPIAQSSLYETMSDAVFVTDSDREIIDLNPAAIALVAKPAGWVIGKPLPSIFPEMGSNWDCRDNTNEARTDIEISRNGLINFYEVIKFPLFSDKAGIGCLITLRNITDRHNAQAALETANRKLNLLSDITRHDIMNQLTILLGYVELVKEKSSDTEILGYIEREEHAASTIREQIQFTREYQNIGMKAPLWQDVRKTFHDAAHQHATGVIGINADMADLEVYADPLFQKAFYNLIDNSLRYGGDQMKNIRVSWVEGLSGLVITYEDNGRGIPDNEKMRIFERGFGKTGGQGLFLVQEILAITGITIRESGIPGAGARFEIIVPKGMYRYSTG